ncbi:hypothetical protein EFR40_03015, partial [Limosilactobacillus fermentum]
LEQKKGGARCKHRPPPKMTHQQDLTKSLKKQVLAAAGTCFLYGMLGSVSIKEGGKSAVEKN